MTQNLLALHALGREHQVEVIGDSQAAALEEREKDAPRPADGQRGLVRDERSAAHRLRDIARDRLEDLGVDLAIGGEQGGNDHHHDVGAGDRARRVRRRREPTRRDRIGEQPGHARLVDRTAARIDRLHLRAVEVGGDHRRSSMRELARER